MFAKTLQLYAKLYQQEQLNNNKFGYYIICETHDFMLMISFLISYFYICKKSNCAIDPCKCNHYNDCYIPEHTFAMYIHSFKIPLSLGKQKQVSQALVCDKTGLPGPRL